MSETSSFNTHPSSLPIEHTLQPQFYDGFQIKQNPNQMSERLNENEIPAIVTNVPVEYESDGKPEKALIRLANMWIDPERPDPDKKDYPAPIRPKVTMIYIGGGDSDALANTGIAAEIRKSQNRLREIQKDFPGAKKPEWDISSVLAISHPVGAPRTEQMVDKKDVKKSAEIIYKAIQKARAEGSIKTEDKIVLMGASNGGAISIELAQLLGDELQQMILVEPAAISKQKNMTLNFGLSAFRTYGAAARAEGLGPKDTFWKIAEETRKHWTQPGGAPQTYTEMLPILGQIERYRPKHFIENAKKEKSEIKKLRNFQGLKALIRRVFTPAPPPPAPPEYRSREEIYGIPKQAGGLNTEALGNDTTKDAREKMTKPVMVVISEDAKVVNPRRTLGKLSDSELINKLFPNARVKNMRTVPGNNHGFGDNPAVWTDILSTAQSIPLAEAA